MRRILQSCLLASFAWSGGRFSQLLEPADGVATDTETGTSTDAGDPSAPNVTTFDGTGPVEPTSTGNDADRGASEGESGGSDGTGVRTTEAGSTSTGSDSGGTESSQDTSDVVGLCCFPQPGPGCDDSEGGDTCVCKFDSYCCDVQWDDVCVDIAIASGCIDCGVPPIPEGPSDCCEATNASGCLDVDVESCACEFDAFCCNVQWDETCVSVVEENECGCGFGSAAESDAGTDTDTDTD
ncbi:MAG: hypothetical protein JKY37_08395, partial [Nannocystaceae bacterium]|nr:hypothetical protein [Nannocystaceae bacterium]